MKSSTVAVEQFIRLHTTGLGLTKRTTMSLDLCFACGENIHWSALHQDSTTRCLFNKVVTIESSENSLARLRAFVTPGKLYNIEHAIDWTTNVNMKLGAPIL